MMTNTELFELASTQGPTTTYNLVGESAGEEGGRRWRGWQIVVGFVDGGVGELTIARLMELVWMLEERCRELEDDDFMATTIIDRQRRRRRIRRVKTADNLQITLGR